MRSKSLKNKRAECPIELYTSLTYNVTDDFEWDENKQEINIQKHRIDFIEILDIFSDVKRIEIQTLRKNEIRITTVGYVSNFMAFVVYVNRGSKKQIKWKGNYMNRNITGRTDWEWLKNQTDEEIEAAVASDPDTFFLTDEEMKQMKRVHPVEKIDVKEVRSLLQMTQEQFAHYFGVNPRTIQEWEQKRRKPSSMARNFLKVIAYNPRVVREALAG